MHYSRPLQEKICEDSASFDLTSFDIASCIEDIDQCLNFVLSKEDGFDVDERAGRTTVIECAFCVVNMFWSLSLDVLYKATLFFY